MAEASCAAPIQYVRPEVNAGSVTGNEIVLIDSRHPCVEMSEGMHFIPNDVQMVPGSSACFLALIFDKGNPRSKL